jgi:hypothetical protein
MISKWLFISFVRCEEFFQLPTNRLAVQNEFKKLHVFNTAATSAVGILYYPVGEYTL